MDPITLAILGAAIGGGAIAGHRSAKAGNKRLKGLSDPVPPYSGYRPPRTEYLRPVEKMITDTVMRRSQGQDVGYDENRRRALLEDFDIEQGRDLEDQKADLQNKLSGMGLSRNAAAYDDLIGRALREAGREKNLYRNRVDIEDLTRRNEERDVNTGRLSDLNRFNFGQENQAANFDLDVYQTETGNELRRRGLQFDSAQAYQDPMASALESGINTGFGAYALGNRQPTVSSYDPYYDALIKSSEGYGVRKDLNNQYLDPARKRGINLYRG